METKPITLNTLLISAAALIAIELAVNAIIARGLLPFMIGQGLARIFQIIVIVVIVRRWGKGLISIGISRPTIPGGLSKGFLWSLGFGIATGFVFGILFLFGVDVLKLFQTSLPLSRISIFLFLCVGVLIAPIAEEIFFRGILYGFFRRFGVAPALMISTLIFVLLHLVRQGIPLTQIVGGLLFAVAYEVEKNLFVPIVIHCLGNLAIFSLSLIAQI